ncbi:MAG: CpaD family pilus assembly protein [Alphaproteobacteria bacterium]|nr:CpaD family pilus assembly protein [Alphaproteobacteria bacterium]MBU1527033.1 CpaD family pilus assembly protein [Alphaproteobacteria bacterium]MBU2117252.1 CpaD family pilus assembly protein [Alphaproteobacteria bacterium]MBU2352400.1 CpaD family pilus assembly protein [Alphaproteobacteria bacterium]MBU2382160.1 CpaD family pilus assembly protein [Alphaproteobacteria bacterium]
MRTGMRTLQIAAVVAALAVGGCAQTGGMFQGETPPLTPLSHYALRVEPGLDRIALAVHETGLSAAQTDALAALAHRWKRGGTGRLFVQAPSGDDQVSAAMAWSIHDALVRLGVPAPALTVEAYGAPDGRAPVLVGFETVQAVIPDCAAERGTLNGRVSNGPSPGLGCSVNANLAAQIDDPRDIVRPRGMTPSDSGRAAVVFQAYRAGEPTSATQEPLVEGRIARAVE